MRSLNLILKCTLRKKSGYAILAIVTVSAFFVYIASTRFFLEYGLGREYSRRCDWPAEIKVWARPPLSGLTDDILKQIRRHPDVDFVVYPASDGIWINDAFSFKNKNYTIWVLWCDVKDPVFPVPEFMVRGRFFTANDTHAILIDSMVATLLRELNFTVQIINTKIKLFNRTMTVVGVFMCQPSYYGVEDKVWESYWGRTNVVQFYVPLETYRELVVDASRPEYRPYAHFSAMAGVKVKSGANVGKIAEDLASSLQVHVQTYLDFEQIYSRDALTLVIPGVVGFLSLSLMMIWDARKMGDVVLTLRGFGWLSKDIAKVMLIRSVFITFIGAIIAFVAGVIVYWHINFYTLNSYSLSYILRGASLMFVLSLTGGALSSVPATILTYRGKVEDVLR